MVNASNVFSALCSGLLWNLKTNPGLQSLSWEYFVAWSQCRWRLSKARSGDAARGMLPVWCQARGSLWQERSFLLQKAERNNHPTQNLGPSSALLPGEVICGGGTLIQLPPVLLYWWHCLQRHSKLWITPLWLMAKTFSLPCFSLSLLQHWGIA